MRGKERGNGLFAASFATRLEMNNVHISHGGGTGQHHTTYISGVDTVDIRNCSFRGPYSMGHALKIYGRQVFIAGTLIEMTAWVPDSLREIKQTAADALAD